MEKPSRQIPSTTFEFMLTISATQHSMEEVAKMLEILGRCVFQEKCGETTRYEHYQCLLQTPSPMHAKTLKNKLVKAGFTDAHIETREGGVAQCAEYCTKEETRIDGPWRNGEIDLKNKQGQRTTSSA